LCRARTGESAKKNKRKKNTHTANTKAQRRQHAMALLETTRQPYASFPLVPSCSFPIAHSRVLVFGAEAAVLLDPRERVVHEAAVAACVGGVAAHLRREEKRQRQRW